MESGLFRKKSMERISSPEQLQDYMRVTSPGIWMVLLAVIALLVGGLICASAGRLETTVSVEARVDEDVASVKLSPDGRDQVKEGMALRLGGKEAQINCVYVGEDGVPVAAAPVDLPDGSYDAAIVLESIAPISFLINSH